MGMEQQEGVVRFVNRAHEILEQLTYYKLLNIESAASAGDVRKAYYKLAARLHPDLYSREIDGEFKIRLTAVYSRVVEAYQVLSDGKRRKLYDEQLAKGEVRLTADAENKPAERPEDKIANPHAKRFYLLGVAALKTGDKKGAAFNLKLALSAEPGSAVIQEALGKAEGK